MLRTIMFTLAAIMASSSEARELSGNKLTQVEKKLVCAEIRDDIERGA